MQKDLQSFDNTGIKTRSPYNAELQEINMAEKSEYWTFPLNKQFSISGTKNEIKTTVLCLWFGDDFETGCLLLRRQSSKKWPEPKTSQIHSLWSVTSFPIVRQFPKLFKTVLRN